MVDVVQNRAHGLGCHSAFHLALIAFVCVVTVLLSGSSLTRLAGTDRLTLQIDHRIQKIEARNQTPVPRVSLDIRFSENFHQEVAELLECTDDDETERGLLPSHVALRLNLPAFGSQTGLYESAADRAPTPFRLLAFSSRGTPSA